MITIRYIRLIQLLLTYMQDAAIESISAKFHDDNLRTKTDRYIYVYFLWLQMSPKGLQGIFSQLLSLQLIQKVSHHSIPFRFLFLCNLQCKLHHPVHPILIDCRQDCQSVDYRVCAIITQRATNIIPYYIPLGVWSVRLYRST